MTSSRFQSFWTGVDVTPATWRNRAVRYVLIYLSLVAALVGARYGLQDVRPKLRAAQTREAELVTRRDELTVRVQTLENPQRIRDWAFANGMRRFAEAPKTVQGIAPVPVPSATSASSTISATSAPSAPQRARTVEVKTQWR